MNTRTCRCGAAVPDYRHPDNNSCSWDYYVAQARADGCPEYAPNGLPIRSVRADGLLLEHPDADHPTYIFPVDVDGEDHPETIELGWREYPQSHALIYTDGRIAITLYECDYAIWSLCSGEPRGGRCQHKQIGRAHV